MKFFQNDMKNFLRHINSYNIMIQFGTLFSCGVKRTVKVDDMPGATLLPISTGLTTLKNKESSSTTFTSRGIYKDSYIS